MAIELSESFQVNAPVERVWQFMLDPESVAACMPGAALTESIDDRNFVGSVKVKIGAITAKYAGNIAYTSADEPSGTVVMLVEAKEKGGGTVSGTITTRLAAVSSELTDVQCESAIDMTGRIVQVGRGMIEGVAGQIIGKFVVNVRTVLEAEPAPAPAPDPDPDPDPAAALSTTEPSLSSTPPASPGAAQVQPAPSPRAASSLSPEAISKLKDNDEAINMLAVAWQVIWDGIKGFFRRLFGRRN